MYLAKLPNRWWLFCALYTCTHLCDWVQAQPATQQPIVYISNDNTTQIEGLNASAQVLTDATNTFTFDQISSKAFQAHFIPYQTFKKNSPKLQKNKTYWAKIAFRNHTTRSHWVLYAGSGAYITLYTQDKGKRYQQKSNGRLVPKSKRDIGSHIVGSNYKFNVLLPQNSTHTLYLKLKGKLYPPRFALKLETPATHLHKKSWLQLIQSFFQGALWIMIIYNLILFAIVKDRTYLYYTAYILTYSVYYLAYYDFFAKQSYLQIYISAVSLPITFISYFLFMQRFVNAQALMPRWTKVIQAWLIGKVVVVVSAITYLYFTANIYKMELVLLLMIFTDLLLMAISLYLLFKSKNTLARYFIIGSFFLMLGWGLSLVSFFKVIQVNFNENYFSQAGLFLELALFSVGLGYRERKNEQDKRIAQEKNARLLKDQNKTLEYKVKERTLEISNKNKALQEKQAQIEEKNNQLVENHDLISRTHDLLNKAYKSIQASIQSGLRIQKAVLPFEERMRKALPKHFVFFRPRDVVSGDFYWFEEVRQQQFLVAADCTGHGIPGAFMTMLCTQALNDIIMRRGVYSPERVLNALDQLLPKILKTNQTSVRDGMDIVLCVIDPQARLLCYAGAMNPLLYIQDNEMTVIKGTRYGINGHRKGGERIQFALHTIDISTPTMIYMFSDGIQDQFGGEQGKKFSSKRLRNLLMELHALPIDEQKQQLAQAVDQWQGDLHQIDDMLLIGARLETPHGSKLPSH
ncbi:stage II sporulation protein E (SpoIIE) [Microscilla marina ATCC 23134]|uniref:Stage II sporulation protein E (SpoIIE) n=1 Tax=Microscilla marina ATCC 23134 TaxID=313606 RepID=A1ZV57_MICM2|nr:stage II sporulation protein E (SpoIIE) [Microscilla marina ATCC 23134]